MSQEININTEILSWAISRAGYKSDELLKSFPKINDWIERTKSPTLNQLALVASKLKIPFGYFFLKEIPQETQLIPYFRTKGDNKTIPLEVTETINILKQRQLWLEEYLEDEGFDRLSYVGKFNENSKYQDIVKDIRQTLDIDTEWTTNFRTHTETLKFIADKIESKGTIVVFNGVVGNNPHRPVKVDDCRGFVLLSNIAPFIFVNAGDYKGAQLFTIIHELAHIWIGEEAAFDIQSLMPADTPAELLCNMVAAELLVPESSFVKYWNERPDIDSLSRKYKVSRIVIARRALDLQLISKNEFYHFYNSTIKDFLDKKKDSEGGNFMATQRGRLSMKFMGHLNNALRQDKILYRDAYQLTNLKGETYRKFIHENL